MKKNNKGNSILTTPIIVAIGMIMVSILIILVYEILVPYIWYEKLSSTCIKYLYIMEEYGYLTGDEAGNLKNELIKQGFDKNKLEIDYTNNKKAYGDQIYLDVAYQYEIKFPLVNSQIIEMNISRSSVSKR